MRTGIMGGTFDPIHIGHLILGEAAWQQLKLDRVLFMPSGNPPHKKNRTGGASDEERLEMVRLAIAGNPHFVLSDREMNAEGFTYTYKTLESMKAEDPKNELFFIIGADSLVDFPMWREPQRICDACTLVAATRNHVSSALFEREMQVIRHLYNARVEKLHTVNLDVSSHEIRKWVREGLSPRYYVPDSVAAYMAEKQIYCEKSALMIE